jgi:transcriptional regulator with XRE-family HTH domain|nr:MAG TPA_asm: LAMBDA REPRESSOR (TRIPLE MUTANT)/DNA COMPLEX-DNA COMPLEX, DOUBLE HELIX, TRANSCRIPTION-DNA.1A [Caudoviricetes sp.]
MDCGFLESLNSLRSSRSLSLQQISDRSGVPLPTVRDVFNGRTQAPRADTLVAIVHALDGSLDDLFSPAFVPPEGSHDLHSIMIDYLRAEVESQRRELHRLRTEKALIVAALVAVLLGVISLLVCDRLNPNVGWFRDIAGRLMGYIV